tara:strand:- start:114 stop:500 length:387 start_codon:yes stop_codon:yes gene_type:complete
MLTIRKKPFNYFENFDLLFDNIFNESLRSTVNTSYHYQETEKDILIEMALPGINKKNIELIYSDGFLNIKHINEKKDNSRWVQDFNETIKIIKDIDENKISAKFENGIMYIKIPKKEKVINEKVIQIK